MSFPSLPAEKAKVLEDKEAALTKAFLADPAAADVFKSEKDLEEFEKFRKEVDADRSKALDDRNPRFLALASALSDLKERNTPKQSMAGPEATAAEAYERYSTEKSAMEAEKQSERLKNTIGGRIGVAMETVFKPIGFDWRTNVALLGGFAAKEVIVATLGTAYSLGEVDPEKSESLSEKLSKDPDWNPLMAFTLLLFVMLYNPCIATLVTIRRESGSWRWVVFAMLYTTLLAYFVALVVHSAGTFLRVGV